MLILNVLALALATIPSLVYAALFSSGSGVEMVDEKGFKKAMKLEHCQRMSPEYIKAAKSLHPLVPAYAVDCDDDANKRLCAEQRIQGFPTLKVFPRGNKVPPMVYESGDRTAGAIFKWASLRVPNHVDKVSDVDEIKAWVEKNDKNHRALLLTKEKRVPLLWKVLGNNYHERLNFAVVKDEDSSISSQLNLSKETKVVLYPSGSHTPLVYEGITKSDSLGKFFDSLLDGTADILNSKTEKVKDEL